MRKDEIKNYYEKLFEILKIKVNPKKRTWNIYIMLMK